jgi:hypothetical protein
MNIYDARGTETAFRNASSEKSKAVESWLLSAFMALPMSWTMGHGCPLPATAQNALFFFACQEATAAVMAARRRRQMFLTRGAHLWN